VLYRGRAFLEERDGDEYDQPQPDHEPEFGISGHVRLRRGLAAESEWMRDNDSTNSIMTAAAAPRHSCRET